MEELLENSFVQFVGENKEWGAIIAGMSIFLKFAGVGYKEFLASLLDAFLSVFRKETIKEFNLLDTNFFNRIDKVLGELEIFVPQNSFGSREIDEAFIFFVRKKIELYRKNLLELIKSNHFNLMSVDMFDSAINKALIFDVSITLNNECQKHYIDYLKFDETTAKSLIAVFSSKYQAAMNDTMDVSIPTINKDSNIPSNKIKMLVILYIVDIRIAHLFKGLKQGFYELQKEVQKIK